MLKEYDAWFTNPNQDLTSVKDCDLTKIGEGSDVFLVWSYSVSGDLEASKLNVILSKSEVLKVEGGFMSATDVQPVV